MRVIQVVLVLAAVLVIAACLILWLEHCTYDAPERW